MVQPKWIPESEVLVFECADSLLLQVLPGIVWDFPLMSLAMVKKQKPIKPFD